MSKKPKSNVVLRDMLKYEVAAELGFLARVVENGWGSLTAQETGLIGGVVSQRLKEMNTQQVDDHSKEKNDDPV